jgi:hypothetical protein
VVARVADGRRRWQHRRSGEVVSMQVKPGDRVVVETEHVGEPEREGEVLQIIEGSTSVTYRVRWNDGRETLFTPAAGSMRILGTR